MRIFRMSKPKYSEFDFISQIARLTPDGEEVDGEEYVMENDDAVATLSRLIDEARQLVTDRKQAMRGTHIPINDGGKMKLNPTDPKYWFGVDHCSEAFREGFRNAGGENCPTDIGDWFVYYEVKTISDAAVAGERVAKLEKAL